MTPAEIRASILRLTELVATTQAVVNTLLRQQEGDQAAIEGLNTRQAENHTRLALMERDAEIRAKRESDLRAFRLGFWIAVFSAVASFVGSLVVAYYSSRVKR